MSNPFFSKEFEDELKSLLKNDGHYEFSVIIHIRDNEIYHTAPTLVKMNESENISKCSSYFVSKEGEQ